VEIKMSESKSKRTAIKVAVKAKAPSSVRALRIANKMKVSADIKDFPSSKFNVVIYTLNVIERFGILVKLTDHEVVIKTKPKSSSSKEGFKLIDPNQIVTIDGSLNESCKVRVEEMTLIDTYKNVEVEVSAGYYHLTDDDGFETKIKRRGGVVVEAVAYLEKTKTKPKSRDK
jgi:hypothetical protein